MPPKIPRLFRRCIRLQHINNQLAIAVPSIIAQTVVFYYTSQDFCKFVADMNSLSLYTKLEALPKNLKQEVSDFIDFLMQKSSAKKNKIVPQFGSAKGKIKMSPDFDQPLDDFKEYM
jgi:Protein of unknown function (DUF2281)